MNFYENVCVNCRNKGITLSALLLQMNMSKSNIRNWKNGVLPKLSVRKQIADILCVPMENFLTDEEVEILSSIKNEKGDEKN